MFVQFNFLKVLKEDFTILCLILSSMEDISCDLGCTSYLVLIITIVDCDIIVFTIHLLHDSGFVLLYFKLIQIVTLLVFSQNLVPDFDLWDGILHHIFII